MELLHINIRNLLYFCLDVQNRQVLHRLGEKEQSIPRERNIVGADLEVIVTDDLENQKRHSEDDLEVTNHRVVVIDPVVDLGIEM